MHDLLRKLSGGDLRSIGRSEQVARKVASNPALVGELVAGLGNADPVIRMRCADALEKASRQLPQELQRYARELLRLLRETQSKEVRWHLLQMAPRVKWKRKDMSKVYAAVTAALSDSSSIVKTCAMQALIELLPQMPQRRSRVVCCITEILESGTPAMRARARKLLHALERG